MTAPQFPYPIGPSVTEAAVAVIAGKAVLAIDTACVVYENGRTFIYQGQDADDLTRKVFAYGGIRSNVLP